MIVAAVTTASCPATTSNTKAPAADAQTTGKPMPALGLNIEPTGPEPEDVSAGAGDVQAWAGIRFDSGKPLVKRVIRSSPAEKAGLQQGDVVLSVDGRTATGASELVAYIKQREIGDQVAFVIDRGGTQHTLTVTVALRPPIADLVAAEMRDRPAPAFSAMKVTGPHPTSLEALKGDVVLLVFWATWCGPCEAARPYFEKWQSTYGPKGLRVVGLTAEPVADVTTWLTTHWLSYSIGVDADGEISASYMVPGTPTMVVIDRKGIVKALHVGATEVWALESVIQAAL